MLIKEYTLAELASYIDAEVKGDPHCKINSIASLEKAKRGQLSFLYSASYKKFLSTTAASAVILSAKDIDICPTHALIVRNPEVSYAKIARLFEDQPQDQAGIHPTVVMGESCKIASNVSIGPYCVIGHNVVIGEQTVIHAGTIIGDNVVMGTHCQLWSRVTLYHGVQLGHHVIIQSGAVIGADGFGLANDNGTWVKIPQLGRVVIGDYVEIGANTAIDRGALEDTVIGNGVKLDNLIQIGHNVTIGENTVIAGCVGIAGSARIGKNCMIGGAAAINGHIDITDGVILTAGATVPSSIDKPGFYSSGTGLQTTQAWRKNVVRFQQLDELARRLKKLEKVEHESNGD